MQDCIDTGPLPHVLVISAIHKPDLETKQADSVRRPLFFQLYGRKKLSWLGNHLVIVSVQHQAHDHGEAGLRQDPLFLCAMLSCLGVDWGLMSNMNYKTLPWLGVHV